MIDRRFLLLCGGEVLVVAVGNLAAAFILQVLILAAYLDDRQGYPVFVAGTVLFAAVLVAGGTIFLPLLGLAGALGCGYVALTLRDYRLVRWARGET